MLTESQIYEIKVNKFTVDRINNFTLMLKETNDGEFFLIQCRPFCVKPILLIFFSYCVLLHFNSFRAPCLICLLMKKRQIQDVTKIQKLQNYCMAWCVFIRWFIIIAVDFICASKVYTVRFLSFAISKKKMRRWKIPIHFALRKYHEEIFSYNIHLSIKLPSHFPFPLSSHTTSPSVHRETYVKLKKWQRHQ